MALKPLDRIPQSLSLRTQLVLITSMLIALSIAVTSLVAISALRAQMAVSYTHLTLPTKA